MRNNLKRYHGDISEAVLLDSEFATKLGFTSKNGFEGYLWHSETKGEKRITISFIISSRGYLLTLFANILTLGFDIAVPTPFPRMEEILIRRGFKRTFEYDKDFQSDVEVWLKKAQLPPL